LTSDRTSLRLRAFPLAALLFFCSGALGLGYELVWIRKAALVVGASQIALSTILTSFFLGLGIGSLVVGTVFRSRRRSPLVVYGLFEIAIGGYALAFPWLFDLMVHAYGALYPLAAGSDAGLLALRFTLLFVLCLPPTFLMGGTLPLLLDGLVAEDRSIGARTSLLYSINVLGAVAGVLVTCYWAIPQLGMNGSSIAGGMGNLALGIAALALFRGAQPIHAGAPATERPPRFFPIAGFVSGFIAIGYQIGWARYFGLLEVTTIYTTAMLLAVYLLALSAGSLALALCLRCNAHPLRVLAAAQLLIPPAALWMLDLWEVGALRHRTAAELHDGAVVPLPTQEIASTWAFWSEAADTVFFAPLLKVALVVFVPVALIGIGVPALITAATSRSAALRSSAGLILFWNTLGASLGAFATGYALLPLLGLHRTLLVLGIASLGLALAAWRKLRAGSEIAAAPAVRIGGAAITALSVAAIAAFFVLREDVTRHALKHHGFGRTLGYGPLAQELDAPEPAELVEVIEGPLSTSFVFENDYSIQLGSGCVSLASVAKNGISGQAVQGHLPALFFPGDGSPRNCLGICLGSGQSFGALLMYPVERLDIVDISPSVVDLSLRRFAPYNHGLGADPRVRVHLDDGRHFIQRAPDALYDIVSMEPPPPAADGVYSLYSAEFYREVRRALSDTGVLMQWLPLYRITPMDTQSIVKTLAEVFPETFVVFKGNQDLMTLSYKARPRFVSEAIARRCEVFARERNVAGARFGPACQHPMASPQGILAALMTAPADVARMSAPAIYRDDTQILSYGSGDRHLLHRYRGNQLGQISFAALPVSPMQVFAEYFDPPLDAEAVAAAERERAAAMQIFRVPGAAALERHRAARAAGATETELAAAALELARQNDDCLRKDRAFDLVEEALAAAAGNKLPEHVAIVRQIVRNHFAVYADLVEARVARIAQRFAGSPLVAAMRDELLQHGRRERERKQRYLLGG
jgi:predicted membrane-bound spermidine synthase